MPRLEGGLVLEWVLEHLLILVPLALYLAILVHHAVSGRRQTRTLGDYYVGGRRMGGVALGLSFFATYSSTNSFVGFAGQAYTYGAAWMLLAPLAVLFSVLAWIVVAPRLRHFTAALDSLTLPDFIGFRFRSRPARVLAAIIVVFASLFYMTAIFKGAGELLAAFLDVPYWAAVLLVLGIVAVYTAVGGFISVVKTDVVQGVIMIAGACLLFAGVASRAGGAGTLLETSSFVPGLFSWDTAMPFPVLLGIMVAGTLKFVVEPRQLSRFYALSDDRAARQGMWISSLAFLVVYSMLVPIGLLAHRVLTTPLADSDQVVPALINSAGVFHPLTGSFLLVAMLAAAMSSLDSVLLVMASTTERDILSLIRQPGAEGGSIRATGWLVLAFAAVTSALALNPPGSIVTLTAFSGSIYAACFFAPVLLGLYWRKGNGTSVVACFCAGLLTLLGWTFLPLAGTIHPVFPALLISLAVYGIAAGLSRPAADARVEGLFRDAV